MNEITKIIWMIIFAVVYFYLVFLYGSNQLSFYVPFSVGIVVIIIDLFLVHQIKVSTNNVGSVKKE